MKIARKGSLLLSHDHAHYLPTSENESGKLNHFTLYAPGGFDEVELEAINSFRKLTFGDGEPLRLMLIGLGQPEDFRCPLFGPAKTWESITPYVVSRHAKKRGQKKDPPECHGIDGRLNFAALVLQEELRRWKDRLAQRQSTFADMPEPEYHLLQQGVNQRLGAGRQFSILDFRRSRWKKGDDGDRRQTAGFRIEFDREVPGPICLGHASHFGLGLFHTVDE